AGVGVAHDDGRPVDRRAHAAGAGLGDLHLGQELGLLVEVVERLADVQVRLPERTAVAAAHIAGADVVVVPQVRAVRGEPQDVAGAFHVDPHAHVAGHAQVVDRGQVPDLADGPGQAGATALHAEPGGGQVALDQGDPAGEAPIS